MIVFDSIRAEGFFSLGDVSIDLNDQNFVLVNGNNLETNPEQSNGSGKSSIFDAIFWTLTGETLRGSSQVVNEKIDTGCRCTLHFHDQSHTYIIIRAKEHKELGTVCKFYMDEELQADQIKKAQEMISSLFPIVSNPDILGAIILLGQGLPYKFSSLSPIARKNLLEQFSGSSSEFEILKYNIDKTETEHDTAMRSFNNTKIQNTGILQGINGVLDALRSQQANKLTKEETQQIIIKTETEIKNLETELTACDAPLQEGEDNLKSLETIKNDVLTYSSEKTAAVSEIKRRLSELKDGVCPTCGKPFDIDKHSKELKESLKNDLVKFQAEINTCTSKLQVINNKIQLTNQAINTIKNTQVSLIHKIQDLKQDIVRLQKDSQDTSDLELQIKEQEQKVTDINIQNNDLSKLIAVEEEKLEIISWIKRQLSREFKSYMLEEVVKFMSDRAGYYSCYFFNNNKKVSVTLSGTKVLINIGGRLYENLSGGERQRVDLAVQFALRDMLLTTSGFSCNLLVLDEAFDNLDSQGCLSLINLCTNEFSDISSIYIVTHHSDINIPYDKQLVVVKNSYGISSIEGSS